MAGNRLVSSSKHAVVSHLPCVLGPAEPDQGSCSGALTFSIGRGQSDGADLSGVPSCGRRFAEGFRRRQRHGVPDGSTADAESE